MEHLRTRVGLGIAFLCVALVGPTAQAQWDADVDVQPPRDVESPEHFALELRIGPYQPRMGDADAFRTVFDDDRGPMLGVELDIVLLRLDKILSLGLGFGFSRAGYSAPACLDQACARRATEETSLRLLPLTGLGVLRFDALARKFNIPFVFTGKIGFDRLYWSTRTGAAPSISGWSTNLRMAAQIALDLNFFEPRAARNLDEEWGINRTFIFFELVRTETLNGLEVGDSTWAAGLGFNF